MTFEELVAEGAAVPLEGWDFSWFDGRATEERPPWGYARLMGERMAGAAARSTSRPGAARCWPPWSGRGRSWSPPSRGRRTPPSPARGLRPLGAHVVMVADAPTLPFADASFDLVVSRHPIVVLWEEIARVLRRGGTYLSQQIGPGSNRELRDFMMGPQPVNPSRSPERARAAVAAAGLVLVDLRACALRVEFFDVAAVVHFLRKVHWTVPGFTPEAYDAPLRAVHELIRRDGVFVSRAQRLLVEARRPG